MFSLPGVIGRRRDPRGLALTDDKALVARNCLRTPRSDTTQGLVTVAVGTRLRILYANQSRVLLAPKLCVKAGRIARRIETVI